MSKAVCKGNRSPAEHHGQGKGCPTPLPCWSVKTPPDLLVAPVKGSAVSAPAVEGPAELLVPITQGTRSSALSR